jgi:hypothetical protein
MKRTIPTILIAIFLSGVMCAARQEEPLPQLMTRADAASGGEQANLCMQVAEQELKVAISAYKQNNSDEGRASLRQIVKYAEKGHSAAIHSGKKMKHTEIKIRQISERLRDMKLNVEVDDQPSIQAAIDKLETFRTEILKSMFGSKSND